MVEPSEDPVESEVQSSDDSGLEELYQASVAPGSGSDSGSEKISMNGAHAVNESIYELTDDEFLTC